MQTLIKILLFSSRGLTSATDATSPSSLRPVLGAFPPPLAPLAGTNSAYPFPAPVTSTGTRDGTGQAKHDRPHRTAAVAVACERRREASGRAITVAPRRAPRAAGAARGGPRRPAVAVATPPRRRTLPLTRPPAPPPRPQRRRSAGDGRVLPAPPLPPPPGVARASPAAEPGLPRGGGAAGRFPPSSPSSPRRLSPRAAPPGAGEEA